MALGLLQGFTTHGVWVLGDMAIVGYDDISFAATDSGREHRHEHAGFTPELVIRRSSLGR